MMMLDDLRKAIKKAAAPAWITTALETMHDSFPDGTSLRYRSSTNNEDLPDFNGAGLYDSKTQDPDETAYQPADGEDFAMEIEFKITADDKLAIKQARPWVFNEPLCVPNLPSDAVSVAEVRGWRDGHSGAAHVLRWNRVLAALGEDTGESAMTVEQSRANEGLFMASRWDRVTRTLEALAACDDPPQPPPPAVEPEVSIAASSGVAEGANAEFALSASPMPSASLTVDVTVTASGGFGVTTGSRQVTISTSGTGSLTVSTSDDSADEPDGSVAVTVDDGAGYTVSTTAGSASVTVADDDDDAPSTRLPPSQVSFSAEDASAAEGGTLRFKVTLSNAANARVRVWWTTRYGGAGEHSAFPDVDYPSRARGWIAFEPGDTEKWVDIALPDDTRQEPSEVFQIYLSFTEGGATIADRDATMTVTDND